MIIINSLDEIENLIKVLSLSGNLTGFIKDMKFDKKDY